MLIKLLGKIKNYHQNQAKELLSIMDIIMKLNFNLKKKWLKFSHKKTMI
jgi:hypothetical protein